MPDAPGDIGNDDGPFEYWPDGHDAVDCFTRYLSGQWVYSFGGIAALDVGRALAVIERLRRKPKQQLRLLEEVQAFAGGVLAYIHEQQEKSTKKS